MKSSPCRVVIESYHVLVHTVDRSIRQIDLFDQFLWWLRISSRATRYSQKHRSLSPIERTLDPTQQTLGPRACPECISGPSYYRDQDVHVDKESENRSAAFLIVSLQCKIDVRFLVECRPHNKSKMIIAPLPNELQDMILEKTDLQTCVSLGRFDIAKKFGDNALASPTRSAITTGDQALVKTMLTTPALDVPDIMLRWKPNPFESAAEHDHLNVLQWLHQNGLGSEPRYTMQRAVNSRRLDIIKYLHDNNIVQRQISPDCFDLRRAVINGDLDIVRYLHKN